MCDCLWKQGIEITRIIRWKCFPIGYYTTITIRSGALTLLKSRQARLTTVLVLSGVILFASLLFAVPLSPNVVVTFSIPPTSSPPYLISPDLTLSHLARSPIGLTSSIGRLSLANSRVGPFKVVATVSYSGQVLSNQTFSDLGYGSYTVSGGYWPRLESSGIPYVIHLFLEVPGQTTANATVNLSPTTGLPEGSS